MSVPTTLYRFFDAAGVLLYVGITSLGPSRWTGHEQREWWADVVRVEAEHFPDRQSAADAERVAIRTENPRYNVVGRPRSKALPPRTYRAHGTGSVTLRGDGRYQVSWTVNGRRYYSIERSEADALMVLACVQPVSNVARRHAIAILERLIEDIA